MLSLYLLILVFDSIYFIFHKSLEVFLALGLFHFVLFVPMNLLGAAFLYKPIDKLFRHGGDTGQAEKRIHRLTWYSAIWILILGLSFSLLSHLSLFLAPSWYGEMEVFSVERMPQIYLLASIPPVSYVNGILPAFIAYFLINDFSFELKTEAFSRFRILYPAGKKRIGLTLVSFL